VERLWRVFRPWRRRGASDDRWVFSLWVGKVLRTSNFEVQPLGIRVHVPRLWTHALDFLGDVLFNMSTLSTPHTAILAYLVVTDLTICIFSPTAALCTCKLDPEIWHRVEKELYLAYISAERMSLCGASE
jgi:hypothetical protein